MADRLGWRWGGVCALTLQHLGSEIQRGLLGAHGVGGLCAGLESPLQAGVLGFRSCPEGGNSAQGVYSPSAGCGSPCLPEGIVMIRSKSGLL